MKIHPTSVLGTMGIAAALVAASTHEPASRAEVAPVAESTTTTKPTTAWTGVKCGTYWHRGENPWLNHASTHDPRGNINTGNGVEVPWAVQLNGEPLADGHLHWAQDFPIVDSITPPVTGDGTVGTYPGTGVVIPYRICKESWFEDPMDPDVIPPIDNADPPFPGFPFEGMELSDEEELIVLDAMQRIQAVAPIKFVEADPTHQLDTFPRGTPMLLIVKGAEADEPFPADEFLDPNGASFSVTVGMYRGPLVVCSPDPGVVSYPLSTIPPQALPLLHEFQLIDEEPIPLDDMGNPIDLPGYNPDAFPGIPEGRLPVLDVDDIDNDGVAAELGDQDEPGVMYVDWEPRPLLDRRFGTPTPIMDLQGIDDANGDGNFLDSDGNPNGDELEGYEFSPFTNLIVVHPDALADGGIGTRSVLIHEIMHALGFYHEHQRFDRDDYIEVFEENIEPRQLGQFTKPASDDGDTGYYDYESIMHYGPTAFSANGQPTMEVVPAFRARFGNVIGTATTLSRGDAAALRVLYGNPNCPSDMDGDLDVDIIDLNLFIKYFLANDPRADINGDLIININDLIEFLDGFSGRKCFSPPPQPPVDPGFGPITDPF
ncbi:MAG: M12 family metallopeptidase [Phycisphaerales bacterium]